MISILSCYTFEVGGMTDTQLDDDALLAVFRFLREEDLLQIDRVNKKWLRVSEVCPLVVICVGHNESMYSTGFKSLSLRPPAQTCFI